VLKQRKLTWPCLLLLYRSLLRLQCRGAPCTCADLLGLLRNQRHEALCRDLLSTILHGSRVAYAALLLLLLLLLLVLQ
jgi:hypothetical protein